MIFTVLAVSIMLSRGIVCLSVLNLLGSIGLGMEGGWGYPDALQTLVLGALPWFS